MTDDQIGWAFIAGVWLCWSASSIAYRLRSIAASLDRLVALAERTR